MTVKEKFIDRLVSSGLFETQAKEVMDKAIPEIEKLTKGYHITWDQPADEYPDQLYSFWWVTVKKVVIVWIEKNIPQAWFKPMFEAT